MSERQKWSSPDNINAQLTANLLEVVHPGNSSLHQVGILGGGENPRDKLGLCLAIGRFPAGLLGPDDPGRWVIASTVQPTREMIRETLAFVAGLTIRRKLPAVPEVDKELYERTRQACLQAQKPESAVAIWMNASEQSVITFHYPLGIRIDRALKEMCEAAKREEQKLLEAAVGVLGKKPPWSDREN